MTAEPDSHEPVAEQRHEPFPDVNAAGALRAGFQRRKRSSAEESRIPNLAWSARSSGAEGYELQGEIARGGMGVIVKAHDRELGRDVALKVLRDELALQPKLVRRFLEEARVTARLDHPGIVPVHEVGRDADGRAFFAMRLVRGRELKRIIELAHESSEGWNQTRALSVIQKVCEAMAYAHDKGVIHRDLKPSNVMVGEFGEVYVMDWGLARTIGGDDTHDLRLRGATANVTRRRTSETEVAPDVESPIVTMDGEVLGTPCYMSPEQAQGRSSELGPRSDVYAVGAMLYHLLAGEMPYVPSGTSIASRQVLMHLVQGPPRALSALPRALPSELIAISEKAMARDPKDRYPNMLAMAEDLRAFLERRVVRAYETGAWAEGRKWVQRNRALSGAMALAIGALVVGLLTSLSLKAKSDANFTRAEHSAQVASDERDRALKIASFLEDTLRGVAPSVALGRDTTMLREMMDAARTRIEKGELASAPEAELRLLFVIGSAYDDIAQYERAEAVLRDAVKKAEDHYHADHVLLARGLCQLGEVLREQSDFAAAEQFSRRGLEMIQRLFPGDQADVAESLEKLAALVADRGDLPGAVSLSRQGLAMRQRLFDGDHEKIALSANNLGSLLSRVGELDAAEPYLRQAIAMQERLFRGDHPQLASSIDNLGSLLETRGDWDQAEALYRRGLEMRRRLFAGDHPRLALSLSNVGLMLSDRGDQAGAEALLRESLEMRRRLYKGDNMELAEGLGNLGAIVYRRGDLAEAEPLYREALEMLRRLIPGDHALVATQMSNLAVLLKARKEYDDAEPLYRDALAMQRRIYTGDNADLALGINNLGGLLEARGDLVGAEQQYREALDMQLRLTPGDNPVAAMLRVNLARLIERGDHLAEAESLFREALRIYRATLPDADPRIAVTAANLGAVLGHERRFTEAEALLSDAAHRMAGTGGPHSVDYVKCLRLAVASSEAWVAAEPSAAGAERLLEWKRLLSEAEHE